ncbi:hypothetical protein TH66_21730 [Carbonactinospora thermoautotrophica]|uniref:PAS domain-containing protein n=2 Tax=Carbonactinospora thermoautotrophica TaxID=1469144 RepID=A0A132MJC5_9ACTN|nr:PAS domain-containing protein [Carbonactinospora thermoautotrophica]KWW97972.1 hypothetical protein TH66_21730 [Carbonactinospora thermoautotrophica]
MKQDAGRRIGGESFSREDRAKDRAKDIVTAFRARLSSLHDACAAPDRQTDELLDVALLELDRAVADMEQLAQLAGGAAAGGPVERERELLRRLFVESPVPTLLLSAGGEIRRGNRAAGDLFGLPLGYLTGKPFYAMLDPATVAVARARLAAVLRTGERQVLRARPRHRGELVGVTFTFQPFVAPGQTEAEVLAVALRPAKLAPPPEEDEAEGRRAERTWYATHALDLVLSCAATLLEGARRPEIERRLAEQLVAQFADWVLVDCVEEGGGENAALRRASVSGPAGADDLAKALGKLDGGSNRLAETVRRTGEPILQVYPDDPVALGTLPGGRTVLGAINAGSLLAVPIQGAGRVRGVITAVRTAERAYFTLADQRVLTELAALLGLTLTPRG